MDIDYLIYGYLEWKEYYDVCLMLGIDRKWNIYFRDCTIVPTLEELCKCGNWCMEVIEYLHKSDKLICNNKYEAIYSLIKNGHLDTLKYLYEKYITKNDILVYYYDNIVYAIINKQLNMLKFLVSLTNNIYHLSKQKSEHLMEQACYYYSNIEIVKYLFSIGIKKGRAIEYAGSCGDINMIKFICENYNNNFGRSLNTAIQCVCMSNIDDEQKINIIKYLQSVGGNINKDAIYVACTNNQYKLVDYFIQLGIQIPNNTKQSLCIHGNKNMIEHLKSRGIKFSNIKKNEYISNEIMEILN